MSKYTLPTAARTSPLQQRQCRGCSICHEMQARISMSTWPRSSAGQTGAPRPPRPHPTFQVRVALHDTARPAANPVVSVTAEVAEQPLVHQEQSAGCSAERQPRKDRKLERHTCPYYYAGQGFGELTRCLHEPGRPARLLRHATATTRLAGGVVGCC